MSAGWRRTGRACCRCSRMPACRNWSMARRTIRSARRIWPAGWSASSSEDGVNLIGGCCGTNAQHIAALDAMLRRRAEGGGHPRPVPVARKPVWMPSVASLYQAVPLRQENAFFAIGERCNANGSKKWREAQEKHDWDGCVAMGREQIGEGSNALDVCTAFVGRDEIGEMNEVIRRFTSSVNAPLVIDSTETPVIAAALKLHGGKPIINSINFEDGEKAAADRLKLAKQFGAAVIALTIDETGMAKTAEAKLRGRAAAGGFRLQPAWPAAVRSADRSADLHHRHRQRGRPQAGAVDAGRHRRDPCRVPRHPDHPRPVECQLRPEPGGARGAEQRVPRPCGARGHDRRDRACLEDPPAAHDRAGGGEGRRGPDLRSPRGGLRSAAAPAGDLRRPQARGRNQEAARRHDRRPPEGPHRRWRPQGSDGRSGRGAEDAVAARHHQQRAARRHEGGGRAVRRRQDAAAVRAAERRDDEGGGGLSRAVHGARRGPGEGHHRARHGEGRRARHRQEPGRHHPDQQRLPGGQSRHQGAADTICCRRRRSIMRTRSACRVCW